MNASGNGGSYNSHRGGRGGYNIPDGQPKRNRSQYRAYLYQQQNTDTKREFEENKKPNRGPTARSQNWKARKGGSKQERSQTPKTATESAPKDESDEPINNLGPHGAEMNASDSGGSYNSHRGGCDSYNIPDGQPKRNRSQYRAYLYQQQNTDTKREFEENKKPKRGPTARSQNWKARKGASKQERSQTSKPTTENALKDKPDEPINDLDPLGAEMNASGNGGSHNSHRGRCDGYDIFDKQPKRNRSQYRAYLYQQQNTDTKREFEEREKPKRSPTARSQNWKARKDASKQERSQTPKTITESGPKDEPVEPIKDLGPHSAEMNASGSGGFNSHRGGCDSYNIPDGQPKRNRSQYRAYLYQQQNIDTKHEFEEREKPKKGPTARSQNWKARKSASKQERSQTSKTTTESAPKDEPDEPINNLGPLGAGIYQSMRLYRVVTCATQHRDFNEMNASGSGGSYTSHRGGCDGYNILDEQPKRNRSQYRAYLYQQQNTDTKCEFEEREKPKRGPTGRSQNWKSRKGASKQEKSQTPKTTTESEPKDEPVEPIKDLGPHSAEMNASGNGGSYNSHRGERGGYDIPDGQSKRNRSQYRAYLYQQQNTDTKREFEEREKPKRGPTARSQNWKARKGGSKQERSQTPTTTIESAPKDEPDEIIYDLGPHGAGIPVNEIMP